MSRYWCNTYVQVGAQGIPHILFKYYFVRNNRIVGICLDKQITESTSELICELVDIDSGAFLRLLPHDIVATYHEVFVVSISFRAEESDVNKFVVWIIWRILRLDFDCLFVFISLFIDEFVDMCNQHSNLIRVAMLCFQLHSQNILFGWRFNDNIFGQIIASWIDCNDNSDERIL